MPAKLKRHCSLFSLLLLSIDEAVSHRETPLPSQKQSQFERLTDPHRGQPFIASIMELRHDELTHHKQLTHFQCALNSAVIEHKQTQTLSPPYASFLYLLQAKTRVALQEHGFQTSIILL
jgi:hypothetical protein